MDKLTFNNQEFYFGWKKNDAAVDQFLKTLPDPDFETAAPLLKDTGAGKDVFFWDVEEKVLGKRVPMWNQGSVN